MSKRTSKVLLSVRYFTYLVSDSCSSAFGSDRGRQQGIGMVEQRRTRLEYTTRRVSVPLFLLSLPDFFCVLFFFQSVFECDDPRQPSQEVLHWNDIIGRKSYHGSARSLRYVSATVFSPFNWLFFSCLDKWRPRWNRPFVVVQGRGNIKKSS